MCMDHVDTDVAPASPMAFLAASRHRALARQDAEFVSVHSCCRCWASLLLCFAKERAAHVNGFLCAKTQISGVHDERGGGGASEDKCLRYVQSLPIPLKVKQALLLLFRELSEEVAQAALKRMKGASAPSADGLPAEVYQAMPNLFVP